MRFLLLMLLGILVFGAAFPAMLIMVVLIGILVIGLIIYRLMRGSSSFTVYTSRDFGHGNDDDDNGVRTSGGRKKIDAGGAGQTPPSERQRRDPSVDNTAMDEEEIEEDCEIIELPATALRKEEAPSETAHNGGSDKQV